MVGIWIISVDPRRFFTADVMIRDRKQRHPSRLVHEALPRCNNNVTLTRGLDLSARLCVPTILGRQHFVSNRPLSQVVAKRSKTAQHSAVCRSILSNRSAHILSRTVKRRRRSLAMTKPKRLRQVPEVELKRLSPTLKKNFNIGQAAIKVPFHAKGALGKLAKKHKVTSDHLLKARRFVELLSNKRSLEWLAKERTKQLAPLKGEKPNSRPKRKKKDTRLSWGHVRHLVSVADHAHRYQLLRDAVRLNWSTTQLIDAIQLREGRTIRPIAGGRPPNKPQTIEEGMLRLQRLSEKWSALYQSRLIEKPSQEPNAPLTLKDRITEFLQGDGHSASVSRDLKSQIDGLQHALTRQADEIGEIATAIRAWQAPPLKQPRLKRK